MALQDAQLPYRGTGDNAPFVKVAGDLAPPGAMRNVRARKIGKNRFRLQQRPALEKLFSTQFGGGAPIQGIGVVSKASAVTDYTIGECSELSDWESRVSGILDGSIWFWTRSRGMYRDKQIDVLDLTTPDVLNNGCQALTRSQDGTKVIAATNFTDAASDDKARVRCYDADTGATLWTLDIVQAGTDRFVNTMTCSATAVHVCTNHQLYSIRLSDGTLLQQSTLGNWSSEAIEAGTYTAGGTEYLYVAFNGANIAGTYDLSGGALGSGVIEGGKYAVHFRAGVMKFRLVTGIAIQVPYSTQLTAGQAYCELVGGNAANHGYCRISEQVPWRPHGALINAMHVHTDGSVVVAVCNQGWGPNSALAAFQPDGATAPYVTILKFTAAGALVWWADTDSIIEVGDGGFFNDIPYAGDPSPDPSISAIRFDSAGDIWAAGRRNGGGNSVMKLSGTDGAPIFALNVMNATASVRQAAIAIDPTDNGCIVGGDRNNSWDGATGQAHAWKINSETGSIMWALDIVAAVSCLAVAVAADGRFFTGTDNV